MESEVVHVFTELLKKAKAKYIGYFGTHDSQNDVLLQELVPELFLLVEAAVLQRETVQRIEALDFEDFYDDEINKLDQPEDTASPTSQGWQVECVVFDGKTYNLEQMKNIVQFYESRKKNKWDQTQRRYRHLTNKHIIPRFKSYIDQNGRKQDKLQTVENYVIEKFCEARSKLSYVSENDLKRWGVTKAKEVELDFNASHTWISEFKKRKRIVSRKITKFVTTKEILERPQLQADAKCFVENVKTSCYGIPSKCIFNFDQSGFNYEKTSQRTLATKGDKAVYASVQSKHAMTHSYSIMPMISMEGKLSPKLLVCLQEPKGCLGPRVRATLDVPPNIFLVTSKSGKLDKGIMKSWIESSIVPEYADMDIALVYDSWTGHTDNALYSGLTKCRRFKIPPKTTSFIQPLDVYFFRQYKILYRKLCDRLMLTCDDIKLYDRAIVLKIQSLVFNQLQSESFTPMLQYSWYACGYVNDRSGYFYNVNEICFNLKSFECDDFECTNESFIVCSHCGKELCIKHFFDENHFHD